MSRWKTKFRSADAFRLLVVLAVVLAGTEAFGEEFTRKPAVLVKDVNTILAPESSLPRVIGATTDLLWFSAYTPRYGRELWVTDGTRSGARMIRDFTPGPASSQFEPDNSNGSTNWSPVFGMGLGNRLLFSGYSPDSGWELWSSDGTSGGTGLLIDVLPGLASNGTPLDSYPKGFVRFGDRMLFEGAIDQAIKDGALYTTDGTAAGTYRLTPRGVRLGGGTHVDRFAVNSKGVYFLEYDSRGLGLGIFRTDGVNIEQLSTLAARQVVVNENVMYALSDGALLRLDVDGRNPVKVADVLPIDRSRISVDQPTLAGGRLFFLRANAEKAWSVWSTDGTPEGTHVVSAIGEHVALYWSDYKILGEAGGAAIVLAHDAKLWATDGTESGTRLLADVAVRLGQPAGTTVDSSFFATHRGRVYFVVEETLWRTDGSPAGTVGLGPLTDSYSRPAGIPLGEYILLDAFDSHAGRELHRVSASSAAIELLTDVARATKTSLPRQLARGPSGTMFFVAYDDAGVSMWRSDGTGEGTFRLASFVDDFHGLFIPRVTCGNRFYYSTISGPAPSLWSVDGAGALQLVLPLAGGSGHCAGSAFVLGNNADLYATSGTPESTILLKSFPSVIDRVMAAGEHVLVSVAGDVWISDGTIAGTKALALPPEVQGDVRVIGSSGSRTFFTCLSGLWLLDRQTGMTTRVAASWPSSEVNAVLGQRLFTLSAGQLWQTDGTPSGTSAFARGVSASRVLVAEPYLYFMGSTPSGTALYRTDGTEAGLQQVRQGMVGQLTAAGPHIFLAGRNEADPYRAQGLWVFLNHASVPVQIEYGPFTTASTREIPTELVVSGTRVFFAATAAFAGAELWAFSLEPRRRAIRH